MMLSESQKKEALTLLTELVSTPSPSGREGKLADYISNWLSSRGFRHVRTDEMGNVRGMTSNGRPLITYCGHMDTVPGILPIFVRNGRVFGRGSSDAKGPLAAMLYSAYMLMQQGIPIEVLAVVQEERNGQGIKFALKENQTSKFFVFGEPSGARKIVVGYRGRIDVIIDFYSASFHASMPWVGRSALQYALDFIKKIDNYEKNFLADEKVDSLSICVTSLKSGTVKNMAPSHAKVELDIRVPERFNNNEIIKDIEKFCKSTGAPRFKVRPRENVEAASSPKGFLLMAMRRSIFKTLGSSAKVVRKTGSGDMNYAIKRGIEAITYGPGDGLSEHGEGENIDVEDFFRAVEVLHKLPLELTRILLEKEI